MANTPLIFSRPPTSGARALLVFGETDDSGDDNNANLRIVGRVTGLSARISAATGQPVTARGSITGLSIRQHAAYVSGAQRPLVNDTTAIFQNAVRSDNGSKLAWQEAQQLPIAARGRFEEATSTQDGVQSSWVDALPFRQGTNSKFQRAIAVLTHIIGFDFQTAVKYRNGSTPIFQEALRLGTTPRRFRFEDGDRRVRNGTAVHFERATGYSVQHLVRFAKGRPFERGWHSKYQEAIKPPIGHRVPPEPPYDPCYLPELPARLVFDLPWVPHGNLVFVCDRHPPGPEPEPEPGDTVVVPIREVYLTINSATLLRLDNGHIIPATAMSMSLDVDSWTWSFSASVPGSALASVQPNTNGDPVVVQAIINTVPFNFILENISRDRSFGTSQLRVGGRGRSAELDAPYAHATSFGNTSDRLARQLMEDVLTFNGVPIGWDIANFNATDWLVPAGVFSHQGTYISALNTIVGAIGAYVQPHNTAKSLDVLLRYPVPSWEWSGVTPDYELPSAVTITEGIEWVSKPDYNRVFVSGQEHGVLGQYTRTGTAGELLAPAVVDPLITHADAARQRGRSIISETGRIATITLRMPILAETGIIKPGKFVRYVDGGVSRIGMTRGVSVDVGMPTIYQTLTLETHLD